MPLPFVHLNNAEELLYYQNFEIKFKFETMVVLPLKHVWRLMVLCALDLQTGQLYAELAEMEAAEACFAKATEYGSKLLGMLNGSPESAQLASEFIEGIVELHIDRARTAWALQQQVT